MKIMDTLRALAQEVLNETNEHMVMSNLKQSLLDALIYFNRFNAKFERMDALKKAVECMDDVRILLKCAVELKCIDYEVFKSYEDQSQQVVKMMVSELKLQLTASREHRDQQRR